MDRSRDRIVGMFLGIAIGDALGMPVETLTAKEIKSKFGRVMKYLPPVDHKWFKNFVAGQWTDDTQLSLAVTNSLLDIGKIDFLDLARRHIDEMKKSTIGWGGNTKKAIENLEKGIPWTDSGIVDAAGNGVAMKVSPVAAYFKTKRLYDFNQAESTIRVFTCMTHRSAMAKASALAQFNALFYCLGCYEHPFDVLDFLDTAFDGCLGEEVSITGGQRLTDRIDKLREFFLFHDEMADYDGRFGDGSSYVYESLAFSYYYFLQAPFSIESLYNVVNAGGDTDTNGSMVGALLGALNGMEIFPEHLLDGLWRKEEILDTANRFCDKFLR